VDRVAIGAVGFSGECGIGKLGVDSGVLAATEGTLWASRNETTMHALPQVIQKYLVHQALEAAMDFPGLARGIVPVARGNNPVAAFT
jgi:hypothetical protein